MSTTMVITMVEMAAPDEPNIATASTVAMEEDERLTMWLPIKMVESALS